jgi:hypothetical protein
MASSTTPIRRSVCFCTLPEGGLSSKEAVILALIAFQGAFLKSSLGRTVSSGTVTSKVVSIGRWSEPCSRKNRQVDLSAGGGTAAG